MASLANEDGEIGFQIAPLVDVVFVLMLFFMASAGFKAIEKELSANLPTPNPLSSPVVPIIIEIGADGTVSAANQTYGTAEEKSLPRLREWLVSARQVSSEDPVIIRPAPEARHERIMAVLNACTQAKIKHPTFN